MHLIDCNRCYQVCPGSNGPRKQLGKEAIADIQHWPQQQVETEEGETTTTNGVF